MKQRSRTRRQRLVVGSTHTLLKPVTVYTVVELRRVPNKRGTTSTTPVWRGACRDCGAEFDQPRTGAPTTRRCHACRGIPVQAEISLDVTADAVRRAAREARAELERIDATRDTGAAAVMAHARQSNPTKPLFTDR